MDEPKPLEKIDWSNVINEAKGQMELITKKGFGISKGHDYIYEAVMVAVYGEDVFEYINAKIDEEDEEDGVP